MSSKNTTYAGGNPGGKGEIQVNGVNLTKEEYAKLFPPSSEPKEKESLSEVMQDDDKRGELLKKAAKEANQDQRDLMAQPLEDYWKEYQEGISINGGVISEEILFNAFVDKVASQAHQRGVEETEKAFGGCKNCYGKGYRTALEFAQSHADFGDEGIERWKLEEIRPCKCERGKQIEKILAKINP